MEFRAWLAMWARVLLGLVVAASLAAPVLVAINDPSERGEALPILIIAAAALGFVMLAMASITLVVGAEAVEVRYGRSPLRTVLPYDQITGVDVVEVSAWRWGGLGYRGSRTLFKRAAAMVRSGPAVRLHLADGSTLAVTVDQAETARMQIASRLRVPA